VRHRQRFLITGTGAGVGKTTVGCALGFALRARGMRVGVMKPVETGCAEIDGALKPRDADALALAAGCILPLELICPYRYRSPLAPAAAAGIDRLPPPDLANIARCFGEIAKDNDVVLVESAGAIVAPITRGSDFADLAAMLVLEVIVVVENRPGCVDATMLTIQRCESRGLEVAGYILLRLRSRRLIRDRGQRGLAQAATRGFLPGPDAPSRASGQDNCGKAPLMRHVGAWQLVLIS
jgi:dethiobiotin synthetase